MKMVGIALGMTKIGQAMCETPYRPPCNDHRPRLRTTPMPAQITSRRAESSVVFALLHCWCWSSLGQCASTGTVFRARCNSSPIRS